MTDQATTEGGNVTQFNPNSISQSDVDEAAAALGATAQKSDRAFPGAVDGRNPKRKGKTETEGGDEGPGVQKIAKDNLPEVPKPDDDINKFIMEQKQKMDELNQKRAELNQQASLIREELKSRGIDTATFDYACKLIDMDEDKRDRIDRTYLLVRQAGCKPVQSDLFSGETKH